MRMSEPECYPQDLDAGDVVYVEGLWKNRSPTSALVSLQNIWRRLAKFWRRAENSLHFPRRIVTSSGPI